MNDEADALSAYAHWHEIPEALSKSLERYVDRRRHLIEDGVSAFLRHNYDDGTLDVVRYIACGGKRLRGILAILMCEALGGEAHHGMTAAIAVELAHAASLAHDDIIDGDTLRRGKPSLHMRYDVATAILVPHLLVPRSVLSTHVYGPRAIGIILEGWSRVAEGQVWDYVSPEETLEEGRRPTVDGLASSQDLAHVARNVGNEYCEIVRAKTAALFEAASALGALAAKADAYAPFARSYASSFGVAYQIADDIAEIEAYSYKPWRAILSSSAVRTSRSLRAICQRIASREKDEMITPSAIAWAKNVVSLAVLRSLECAAAFPESSVRELLFAFPAFAVDKIYAEAKR